MNARRPRAFAFLALLALASPSFAQTTPPPVRRTLPARTILFVGNSFTFGANSPVMRYRTGSVTDLTGQRYGGVPALFRTFAEETGLDYAVFSETQGGQTLRFHYEQRRTLIDRRWDAVVLQEYSTLDPQRPGDPAEYQRYAAAIAALVTARNPNVAVTLTATWTRADQILRPGGHWYGRPITAMADDIQAAATRVRAASRDIDMVAPVGSAWNRAFATGLADPNPYDGLTFGQVDLWSYDQYHASAAGYYLEALVVFGRVTGIDPRTLGPQERAANDLGIAAEVAVRLQSIASDTLRDVR